MAKNVAICIGVNQYDNLPTLKYARRDAESMKAYFIDEVKFEKVYLFTDGSPEITDAGRPFSSHPTYGTLKRFLRTRFETPFMSPGDNLWFFFSGHGLRHADRDYLMPADADPHPNGVEETAIPLHWVTERLRRCGADNVVLLLDACRDEQRAKGVGVGEEKQKGVITIASCSPAERSYEIDEIQQGSFTCALLESLRIQGEGNCATVERLNQRLCYRVCEINRRYHKPQQTPYIIAEPASKYHLILLPKFATLQDLATLKNDAYRFESQQDWELAKQLWIRVNIAAKGSDSDALEAIQRFPNRESHSTGSKSSIPIPRIDKRLNLTRRAWISLSLTAIIFMVYSLFFVIKNDSLFFIKMALNKNYTYMGKASTGQNLYLDNRMKKTSDQNIEFEYIIGRKIIHATAFCSKNEWEAKGYEKIYSPESHATQKMLHYACQ